jgi:hypothetical protein
MIDERDYTEVSEFNWQKHSQGYATRSKKVPGTQDVIQILLHRVIAGVQDVETGEILLPGARVRHHSSNKLDNRRSNLYVTFPSGKKTQVR